MDGEAYRVLNEIVAEYDCMVTPEPAGDENIEFFDVVSSTGEIPAARLLAVLHKAVKAEMVNIAPLLLAAQSHRLTFEDMRA